MLTGVHGTKLLDFCLRLNLKISNGSQDHMIVSVTCGTGLE